MATWNFDPTALVGLPSVGVVAQAAAFEVPLRAFPLGGNAEGASLARDAVYLARPDRYVNGGSMRQRLRG